MKSGQVEYGNFAETFVLAAAKWAIFLQSLNKKAVQ